MWAPCSAECLAPWNLGFTEVDETCIPKTSSCFWRWVPVGQTIFIWSNSPIKKNAGLLANVSAKPGPHYYYFCGHWWPWAWGDTGLGVTQTTEVWHPTSQESRVGIAEKWSSNSTARDWGIGHSHHQGPEGSVFQEETFIPFKWDKGS